MSCGWPILAPMMVRMSTHPRIPIMADTIKSSRPLFAAPSSLQTARLFGAVPAQSPVVRLGRSGPKRSSNSPYQGKQPFESGQISLWRANLPIDRATRTSLDTRDNAAGKRRERPLANCSTMQRSVRRLTDDCPPPRRDRRSRRIDERPPAGPRTQSALESPACIKGRSYRRRHVRLSPHG
jgi:hypothetical protein